MKNQIKIVDLYKDRDIFITGGLGTMGKVLIEKLLRSCSDLKRIFLLIRGKKNKSIEERLQELLQSPLFDLLRSQNPKIFSKLIPINGDASVPDLGISPEDYELIKNVSIFFHSAATTRFNDPICKAVMINTYGTYQVMKLCEKLKNIKAVVHISTTFCNLDQEVLEEKIYPPYADWREIIELAQRSEEKILEETFVKKYIQNNNNTYTLTKHLAEQVVNDYKDKLPIVLIRPSVVMNIISEPIPGWTDAISGPFGLMVGFGTGIVRVHLLNRNRHAEVIAADVAIKAIIVAAYKKVLDERNGLVVYNNSTKITADAIEAGARIMVQDHPFEKCIWNPSFTTTTCKYYFMLSFILFQILPAIFIDAILLIIGRKPFLLKIQKKFYKGFVAYRPFLLNRFDFKSDNTYHLDRYVLPEEFDTFAFNHLHDDFINYYIQSIRKLKKYFLKDPEESTNGAKLRGKILYVLDVIVKFIFYFYLVRWIFRLNFVQNILAN